MAEKPVRLVIDDRLAFLELVSPPGNVMNAAFFESFERFAATIAGLDLDGMIVRGAGRHFSSGADLDQLIGQLRQAAPSRSLARLKESHTAFDVLAHVTFPVVAAVRGCCLGAGLELALACRYRVAEPHAVFALPEATFGLIPGCGGTIRLPRLIGAGKAIELALSGRMMLADEARACGLVDLVVEKNAVMETAKTIIKKNVR